ncbi:MAG: hypothetical protein ACTSVI_12895 [Promethearchaeota archaeon]
MSHSPGYHPTIATPSAPRPIARITKSVETRPVHGTKIVLKLGGCCARMVPAMSAAPNPHFQQRNEAILGDHFSSVIFYIIKCINWFASHFVSNEE